MRQRCCTNRQESSKVCLWTTPRNLPNLWQSSLPPDCRKYKKRRFLSAFFCCLSACLRTVFLHTYVYFRYNFRYLASKLPVVFKRRSTNIACKPLQLVKFSFDVLFQWSSSFFLRGIFFRFFAFPNVSVTKQFFQIFPSNFPHFCLCLFVHCFVCLTALPRLPDVTNFTCPFPLQQQPFVFVLFPHFRFLCFQQVLTQAFASFIDQVALT